MTDARSGFRSAFVILAITGAGCAAAAEEGRMQLEPNWEFVADTVMGGVSQGQITHADTDAGPATRLTGDVSLDNNGGFVQMAANLGPEGAPFDASAYTGITLSLRGNGEVYDIRLRTDALTRPWQSFRIEITAPQDWQTLRLPFSDFTAHRTQATLDPARLKRIGILAVGRAFHADVTVASIGFYR